MFARYLFLSLFFFCTPVLAAITECSLVFPNGAQTNKNNGSIKFDWGSYISDNSGLQLATKTIYDNSGRSTCDGGDCTATGSPAESMDYKSIPSYSTAISVSYKATQSAVPGNYRWINLSSNSTLTLAAGDYIVSGDVHVQSSAQIRVDGQGVVRLIVKGKVQIEHNASVNDTHEANLLLVYAKKRIQLESRGNITGFVYSKDDITLGSGAWVEGAVNGATVWLGSSQSRIVYKPDLVSDLEFGDLCGGSPETVPVDESSGGSCSAIYSDGVQSNSSSGVVNFYWHSRIQNSPDNMIDAPSINDNSGGTSCNSQACGFSGKAAEAIDFNDYSSGGTEVYLGYSERMNYRNGYPLSPGNYKNITLTYDTRLSLSAGDYYVSGDFTMGTDSKLYVTGDVRIFIKGTMVSDHASDVNKDGTADQLFVLARGGLTLGNDVEAVGFFYSEEDVFLHNDAFLTGGVSGRNVTLNSSDSTVYYDSDALANADFGDICGGTSSPVVAPIVEYRFDDCELTSIAEDSIGTQNASLNDVEQLSSGVLHTALDLTDNGTSDWAQLPSDVFHGLDDFTSVFWLNTSVSKSQQNVLHVLGSNTGDDELEIYLWNSDYVVVKVQDKSEFLKTDIRLTDGQWHQVAVTRAGAQVCLFVDGAEQDCVSGVGSGTLSVTNSTAAFLGQEQDSFGGNFSTSQNLVGSIDEFRMFDQVLGNDVIASYYQNESNGLQADGETRTPPACAVTLPSAVLDFAFDELSWSGTGYDVADSASGNHGLAQGGVGTESDGQVCRLGSFDGYDDYVEVPNLSDWLNATASLGYWIRTNQAGSNNTWTSPAIAGVEQSGGTDDIFWGRIDASGRVGVSVGNDTSSRSSASINDNRWHYIVLSRDADEGEYQVFIDGALDTSGSIAQGIIGNSYSSLGRTHNTSSRTAPIYLLAELDELVVFDQVLTAKQVALMYDNQINGLRWDGSVAECLPEQQVDHYGINTDSPTLTCEAATVEVTAYDSSGQAVEPGAGLSVTLSLSDSLDSLTLASGTGSWQASNRTYTFADGETSFSLSAERSLPTTSAIDIDVTDGTASAPDDNGSKDESLSFVSTAFKFYADGVVNAIASQLAGKASNSAPNDQSVTLKAISADPTTGVCSALVSGSLNVGFGYSCDDPSSCALPTSGLTVAGVSVNEGNLSNTAGFAQVPLSFDVNGEASIPFTYLDAGEISLYAHAVVPGEGNVSVDVEGVSNSFVVKPGGLCVSASGIGDATCTSGDASCSAFEVAGNDFDMTVSAHRWNNGNSVCSEPTTDNFSLSNIGLSINKVAPTTGQNANLAVTSIDLVNGTATISNQQVNEVGVYTVTATPPTYLGESIDAVTSDDIGRFYADHFTLDPSASSIAAACTVSTAFSYMGESFDVDYRLQARGAHGQVLENYIGDFIKLSSTQGNLSMLASDGTSDHSSRVSGASGSVAGSSSFFWSAGESDVTSSVVFARASSPDGAFDTLSLGIQVTDADGVTLSDSAKTLDADLDGSNDGANIANTMIRYGRFNFANTHGPETDDLYQPYQAEYFDGSRFVRHEIDECTSISASMLSMRFVDDDSSPDGSYALTPGTLADINIDAGTATPDIENLVLDSGTGRLSFSAPGIDNTGVIYTEISPASWLKYDWDGDGDYSDSPEAAATFGRFRGNDRLIHWFEGN